MMRGAYPWFAVSFLAAALFGWFDASTSVEVAALEGTAWTLTALAGRSLVPGSTITLRFDGGRAQGSDGCNRYTAPYSVNGSTLQIGPNVASTQMACPTALMQQAEAFANALLSARSYSMTAGQLNLLGADGAATAVFAAQSTALAGTAWSVTGYNDGRQALVSVLADTSLTMAFSNDGKAAGSAGCNRYTAGYSVEGAKLEFGPPAATRMICPRPDGVMEQEQLFLKALGMVATARFEGDRLELRSASGALAVTLKQHTLQP
jgi:heat shock protein HslJ